MIRRIGPRWSWLVGLLAFLTLGMRWTTDECPMHAAAGAHDGHEMPVPHGPPVPCDCAAACAAPIAVAAPQMGVGFTAVVVDIPWRARSVFGANGGLGAHLGLPFATAPPRT